MPTCTELLGKYYTKKKEKIETFFFSLSVLKWAQCQLREQGAFRPSRRIREKLFKVKLILLPGYSQDALYYLFVVQVPQDLGATCWSPSS